MTGNELIAFVRSQLDETEEKNWLDTDILKALNGVYKWIVKWIHLFEGEWFYTNCTITTVIDQQTYPLPDGTLYSGASKCTGIVDFIKQSGYHPKFQGDFRKFHYGTSGNVIDSFDIKHKTIWLDIVPRSVFNFELFYYFVPSPITASDTAIDFIPDCEEFIAWKAIVNSKMKVQDSIQEAQMKCKEWQAVTRGHCGSRVHGKAAKFGEDFDPDYGIDETDYM